MQAFYQTFDTVVDTFGLEYTLEPDSVLKEIKRVCKPGGLILLLNEGKSFYTFKQIYDEFQAPFILQKEGKFIDRNWEEILDQHAFEVVARDRKQNGSLYFQILKNLK